MENFEANDIVEKKDLPDHFALNDIMMSYQSEVESNARTYARVFDRVFVYGKGSIITDISGKNYIDCLTGAGTLALGHNDARIIQKLREGLDSGYLLHTLDIMTPLKNEYIRTVLSCFPETFSKQAKIQFCGPTGADAVEAAIKLFKTATGRRTVIAFYGAYHGMTAGALSLTGNLGAKQAVASLMPDVHFFPYPYQYRCPYGLGGDRGVDVSLRHIRQALSDPESGITKPAAVIVEAVQGEGGCIPAPVRWLQGISEITSQMQIPLVIDEVQTGFGRTGTMFAFESAGIIPDAVIISKAAGGGLPISAFIYRSEYDLWHPGAHAGTFRGNQLAMIAGAETIKIIKEENLSAKSRLKGDLAITMLQELKSKYPFIGDIRGKGLLIGIEIVDSDGEADEFGVKPDDRKRAYQIKKACFENGLIIESGGRYGSVLRLLPALNISESLLTEAIEILGQSMRMTMNE
jgi:diaminobutyrate-2-oxoglutarate transaminase